MQTLKFSALLSALVTLILLVTQTGATQMRPEHIEVDLPPIDRAAARTTQGAKDLAIIVSVERYQNLSGVPGAALSASDWQTFFSKHLGISDERILLLQDQAVTPEKLRRAVPEHLQKADAEGRAWFVFIGHGAPYQAVEDGAQITDGLLVGVNARNDTLENFVDGSLRKTELEAILLAGKQNQTILVLDACFSGKTPFGQSLMGTAAVNPTSTRPNLGERDIVFTAAEHNEVANLLPGTSPRRPAFSYVLLGALRGWADRSGEETITVADIEHFVRRTLLGLQTPSVFVKSDEMHKAVLVSQASEQDPGASRLIQNLIKRDASFANKQPCPVQGQVRNIDTQGQCCWPGQTFSSAYGSCIGTPFCPDGLATNDEGECTAVKEGAQRFAHPTELDKCSSAARCAQLGDDAHRSQDPARAAPFYERACDQGSPRGCFELGYIYDEGLGVAQDQRRAAELYQRSCDGGDTRGCANLGVLYQYGHGVAQDFQRAAALYEKSCDGGYPLGCNNLGHVYQHGHGVDQDIQRAAALYQKSCDGDDTHGCVNLGTLYQEGAGVGQDHRRAAELFKKACDNGEERGCSSLGVLYQEGAGVDQDTQRAIKLFQRSCDGGDALGCSNLGVLYIMGAGVDQDHRRAAELFEMVCNHGEVRGCTNLGAVYSASQDFQRAAALYQKGCDGGDAQGCVNLGFLYSQGHGVDQDHRRAAELFQKSCDGGNTKGCTNLGTLYRNGYGVDQDYRRAAELFLKSCGGGEALGCSHLGALYELGHGVDQDYRRAAEFYQKACEKGDADGCANLGYLYEQGHGVRKDIARACELYQPGCEGGDDWTCGRFKKLCQR